MQGLCADEALLVMTGDEALLVMMMMMVRSILCSTEWQCKQASSLLNLIQPTVT